MKINPILAGLFFCFCLMLQACVSAEDIQPPAELFQPQQDGSDERCDILLETAQVKLREEDRTRALLQLSGNLTSACSDLQVIIRPVVNTRSINVYLNNTTQKGAQTNKSAKPFSISMPLDNLKKGKHSITVHFMAYGNEQLQELELNVP